MNEHIYDMLIIGGGPAGYTAALYATRAGLDVLLLEKLSAGGQMALTENIDNYPGFTGGVVGSLFICMRRGVSRGIFSNEAGLGTGSIAHACADTKKPVKQGFFGVFEVFADTMVVCTMTALVVLTSGAYNTQTGEILKGYSDSTLVAGAFNQVFHWGGIGGKFIAIAMFLFAFTTVLGWSHYGSKAWEYLFGSKSVPVFKVIHICTIFFGAVMTSTLAWDISDTFNGLMMIPNLIGVLSLSTLVLKITKNYVDRKVKNKDVKPMISYDPEIQAEQEKKL